MRTLGIADGQTSGAAVLEEGRLLAAVNEERLVRIKLARGFPRESIREALRLSATDPRDVGEVAVAQVDMELHEAVREWPGWFEARERDRDLHARFFQLASRFGGLAPRVPGMKRAYYALRAPAFRQRRRRIEAILREEFGLDAPLRFVHHHTAHAASAYYTSGFDDALVVTLDGGGDGHCSHVYSAKGGALRKLAAVDSYDSLGNYYAYATALCGFKAKRHEGKVTGLAAHGRPRHRALLERMIACEEGRLVNRGRVLFAEALARLRAELPPGWRREDLAASIQELAEDLARAYVAHWLRATGHRRLALAGGLFANVRINQELHELPEVDEVFVHPGMSDEGLGVGAGLAADHARRRREGRPYAPRALETVYLGTAYGERAVGDALRDAGLQAEHHPGRVEERLADELAAGRVVARFEGAMEYGPRALGNRSILCAPGDPSVNDWLNERLRRTEFMPFAPAAPFERASALFEGTAGALDTARFMTITFRCTPWMREHCAGTVHVDGTARPQLVRPRDNPSFHRLLAEYERRSGVPALVNTSFNVHEEPIVRSPADAIRAFLDGRLDVLALGDFVVKGPGERGARPARRRGPRRTRGA